MHRPRVQAVKDLLVRGRLNETVLDIDSPLFIKIKSNDHIVY